MNASTVQIGRYTGIPVAEGGFATVYRALDPDSGAPVALKWAHPDADEATIASLHHEFRLLGEFDYPQLPRALDFQSAEQRPCLVTDWIEGPELWAHPQAGSAGFFLTTLRQIARVLTFVHHRGWVHGDLKPGNFCWGSRRTTAGDSPSVEDSTSHLYLLDFGLARRAGDPERPRGAGTVGYYAPEFLQRLPADGRADWYSVGAMLYEWLFGRRPFAAEDPADEIAGHLEQTPDTSLPFVYDAPDWAREVTSRLLLKTPEQRGEDVYDLLRWLGQFDSELRPEQILNSQVSEHLRSEFRRLDDCDMSFIEEVARTAAGTAGTRWVIRADQSDRERLTRGLVSAVHEHASGIHLSHGGLKSSSDSHEDGMPLTSQIRISSGESGVGDHFAIVEFMPMALLERRDCGESGFTFDAEATLLPWDLARVAERLMGLTQDAALTQRFGESIWRATGGLPGVVADFLTTAVARGQLKRQTHGWDLEESAIEEWKASAGACSSYDEYLGPLSSDERRICDAMAVGRSQMDTVLLREIAAIPSDRFDTALGRLTRRMVMTGKDRADSGGESQIRFRLDGLADVWRLQLPEPRRRALATAVAEKLVLAASDHDRSTRQVLAECFADAGWWDQCSEHAIAAAIANASIERHADAWRYIELAESAANRISDPRLSAHWRGWALMARGDYLKSVGQLDEAARAYREILAIGRRQDDLALLAETLKDLGDVYRMTRQFEKGVRVLRRARQLWELAGNREEAARTLNNLGNMFWVASDHAQARSYYEKALVLARALEARELVALVLSNLGVAYKGDRDYIRAERYYRESLSIREELNSPSGVALTLNNIGVIAFDQGRLAEAAEYFERASNLNLQVGAAVHLLGNRGMLIHIALERGDLRAVISGSLEALTEAETIGDVATGAELRGLLAEAYLRAGDFRLSSTYLQEARAQASGQRNDDLTAHLGLVAAIRFWHLDQKALAIAALDEIEPCLKTSEFPGLLLDSLTLRMRSAVARNDASRVAELWQEGQEFARSVGASHKLAQLAFARLPEDPALGYPHDARSLVHESLLNDARVHWMGAFMLWEARRLLSEGDLEGGGHIAENAAARLRIDGNWETLWKVLAVQGMIEFRRADYEPALAAFDEAARIQSEIGKTIAESEYRVSYMLHSLARQLAESRAQILELTR